MEPWGVDEKSTEEAVEPHSQGEVSSPEVSSSGAKKGRQARAVAIVAGVLALLAAGTLHNWRKAAVPNVSGPVQRQVKGVFGKFADNLLEGASLFEGARGDSAKKLSANKTTKMSGAPLSLPLFFEANRGQADPQVKFLARSGGYSLLVTPTETVFAGAHTSAPRGPLSPRKEAAANLGERAVLRMKLLKSNPGPEISGIKELPGKVNYLIGNNPKDWHTGVPLYEEVRSREVYPGIDQVYHGDQQRLEYDFQVAPGADPRRIRFKIAGADKVAVDENGDLVLRTGKNEFRMRKPVIYQPDGERRRLVEGGFSLQAGKLVAFHVGAYDKKMPLVIDPTIVYATFLGAVGTEVSGGIDLDTTNPAAPKLFVSGATSDATTFTETSSLIGTSGSAGDYAFVAKIDTTTTGAASLNFLTFIGGSLIFTGGTGPCQNFATDLKVDPSGGAGQVEAVVVGLTNCRDFPVTFGGPTTGTDDLFITRLTPSGAAIDISTLLGGNGSQGITTSSGGSSLFVNQEGTVVLTGSTTSTNLPTTANAYSVSFNNGTPGGFNDCYTAKLDRSFNILYLTYLNVGGNTTSTISTGCGVGSMDAAGKIYFGGNLVSATAFSLINGGAGPNGFQTTFAGTPGTTPNGFVAVLDPSLSGLNQMTYATYIGGGAGAVLRAGTVDLAHGMTVVVGDAISGGTTNIPLLNAFQSTNNALAGATTGMITVIDATKTGAASLVASSYFGGTTNVGNTSLRSVAIDSVPGNPPTQRIVVGGQTTATAFPTMNPLQASLVGTQDAVVSVLSVPSPGSTFSIAPLFSTYLGGGVSVSGQGESIRNLITDSNHAIYVMGRTASANFFGNTTPVTTVNGFQATCASCGGGTPQDDLAIFVMTPQSGTNVPDLTVTKTHSGSFAQGQTGAQYSITVTNSGTGPTVGTVSLADSLPSSLTATAMTGTGWTCSIGTLVCTRADALAGGASYPAITLTVNVASNAPPSVTNKVTVSGGSETNTGNNTASDLTAITSSVGACTNNYVGLTNGSWGTPTNWSTGAVPVSTDVVCIPSGITVLQNAALAAANQSISGLNSSGTITFSTSQLTVANNSVANAINVSGGTLAFNGQLTVSGAFTQTGGTFGGTGEVDLNGSLTWSGGTICSALTGVNCITGTVAPLNANGGISFPAGASVVLSSRALTNSGTANLTGSNGSIDMINSSVINNGPGSIWNFANDSTLVFGGGGAVAFNNGGTFEKTGGTAVSTISAPFHNSGTVMGNSGTLSFTGGGNCGSSCSGAYTAGPGGTIAFGAGLFAQSGPLNGTGTLNFAGATMDFGAGVVLVSTTNINITGGTLAGAAPGVIDFETRPNWSGGTMCSSLSGISCAAGPNATTNANAGINFPALSSVALSFRTLNNNATATWSGTSGFMNLINGAVINNPFGSVWNYANDSTLSFGGGTTVAFNNAGTLEKTGGTATSTISAPIHNTGAVLANSAAFAFTGGGNCGSSCTGTYSPASGGTIRFTSGVFAQSGPINGSGTVNFGGATMDFGTGTETISTTTVNFTAGTIGGAAPGVLNFATQLNWTGGTMCSSLNGISCAAGSNATTNANAGINFPSFANVALSFRTLNNNGTATWSGSGGSMNFINGAVINNPAGSVWNFASDSSLQFGGGATVAFNNAGTFEKTGGTAPSTQISVTAPFHNTGTVLGNSANLGFTGGGDCGSICSGTFTAGAGAAISFSGGVFAQSGPINGSGTVNFNGATMNFGTGTETISAATVNFIAGTVGGAAPGILNFATLLNWSGGTMCSSLSGISCIAGSNATTNANAGINFPASSSAGLSFRTLNNNGTATWSGTNGFMNLINGALVNNAQGSVWNYTNESTLSFGGGAAVAFNNAGTFEKTGGTATNTISAPFQNTGTVMGNSGTISFSGGGNCGSSCGGTYTAGTGGTISFANNIFAQSGPINGSGTVNFSGATMDFGAGTETISTTTVNFTAGTIGGAAPGILNFTNPLNWTGGTMCSSLTGISCVAGANATTNANGGINFPASSSVALSFRTLNNNGTATWSGTNGLLNFINGAVINNLAGSVWNYVNDSTLSFGGGNAVAFNNSGTFEKTGGASATQVSAPFNNAGNVSANAATLFFSNTYTQTAGSTTLAGGIVQSTNVHPLAIQGGSLTGTGTVQGDVTNSGGSVAPGTVAAAGAISVSGSGLGVYTQSATGAYNVKIGGTAAGQFDTLTMSGAATLGGPLNVSLINSFSPALGNVFTILTASSVTGTFSSTNFPALAPGLGFTITYGATNVVLSVVAVSSPVANLNPGSLSFPSTIVNTAATVQKVQLQNTGTAPLIITSIQPTGADAANYSYTADAVQPCPISPASLGNGANCLLDIGFLPLTAGTHNNAQIAVTDNSGNTVGSVQTVSLSGTGIVLNSIAVTPAPVIITQGSTQQFTATGTYSDNSTQNLTSAVTWASGTTSVATINAAGLATGVSPGTSNITAKQGAVTSPAAVLTVTGATHFAVSSPVNIIAGTPFSITIFAQDQFNNLVPGYTGTVHFTSSDPLAVLPANSTLTNGSGNFQVTLKTVGSQTYTATDTVTSSITGTSNPVTVGTGGVTHFQVALSGSAVVGSTDSLQVVALDQFGNAVPGYTGTVHFTSTDPAAVLPANTTLTGGVGTFSVTFKTTGSQSVTATDTVTSTITGTSNAITVVSGAATHFQVAVPGIATVGVATSVNVVALDQFNNLATGYTGTVHFTSTDATATLPANTTLTSGAGTFPVTFKTAGSQTVTATDTVTATITGTSNTVLVSTGTATHLLLATLPSVTAGSSFTLAVEALDQFNNIVTTYSGTVHFTSSDPLAVLPANSTLTSGVGSFQVTLKTVGSQTITGTDTVTASITGTSNAITVSSTTATHFVVTAPPSASAGTAVSVSVVAFDQFSNLVTGYAGTVHFTSTDGQAILPANSTLTSGVGSFQVTLKTAGNQTVTATDTVTSSINGTSNTIAVGPFVATHLLISAPGTITAGTPFNIIVTALDQFSNIATGYTGTVHFTSTDGAAILPANVTLINGTNTLSVTLKTTGSQTITGTDTVTATITGTSNIVTVTAATLQNIAVTPANPSIAKGLTQQFTATGMFSDGSLVDLTTQVTWNSTAPGVATINATGLATAVGAGTSNITASLLGVTSPIDVLTVTPAALQSITVTPATPVVTPGNTVQYTATGHFSDGTTGATGVNWTSSDTTTATINAAGLATGIKTGGPITITATSTSNGAISGTATLVVASPIGFVLTGSLSAARTAPTATVLNDGRVLVVGGLSASVLASAELYDAGTGTFTSTGSLNAGRYGHTATLLADGRVLVAGGATNGGGTELASAEVYDPKTGTFTALGNMTTARFGHAATWLPNGTVLITGGVDTTNALLSSAEIFDPSTGKFTSAGNMTIPRVGHTATLGIDNIVIIAGGGGTAANRNSVEIYDTGAPAFAATNSMIAGRADQTASVLQDNLLVAGGFDFNSSSLSSAEIRNDDFSVFTPAGNMTTSRVFDTATTLNNGTVLFAGGYIYSQNTFLVLPSAELYDPIANTFGATGSLNFGRDDHAAVRLNNGKALVLGGDNSQCDGVTCSGTALASAELFTPTTFTQPGLTAISLTPANPTIAIGAFQRFTATGTGATLISASVTWSSSNPAVMTITNDATNSGTGFAVGPGTATITGCEGAVCGSTTVTVPGAVQLQTITVAPASASVAAGLTQPFTATGHFSDGTSGAVSVNWTSSNTAIATINASGVATGVAPGGPVTITATSTVNGAISGTAQLTVTPAGPTLQSITVTPANPTLPVNGTQAFIAIGHFSDGTTPNLTSSVTWGSDTTGVATINAAGVATGVSAGTATISATQGAVSGTTLLTVTATTARAYVGDVVSATCCLDVIDIATNTIVKQIPITNVNEPLGITPDQTRVYIPDNVGSILDVIDTTTNTLVNTIPVGNGTTAVVINPNGQFGYVSSFNDNNVDVFNVATSAVVASVPIGFPAGWISITPDGSLVYAGSAIDGRVAVINTSTNTLSTTFTLTAPAGQPAVACVTGPTFNSQGTLGYFALLCGANNTNGNTVDVLSIPNNTLVTAITVGTSPFQSAVTPDGSRLYVANARSNNVSVINTATNTVIAIIPMPGHPESIAVTPDGAHVYVADTNAATVSVIQTSTNTVTSSIATTVPFGIVIASPPAASAATTLTLTPSNLIFGPQVDGTQSAAQTINVKNPGATPVTLTSIFLSGPNIGDFRLTNGCPIPPATLGAGASCNLQISSFPTINGQREALVTINSTNGVAASTQSAPLSGTGISLVSIAVTPVNPSVIATNKVQFTATGTFSDNSTQNLTSSVSWTSSSTAIATINASGLATGVAAGGPITITATSGNIFGTTQLTVTPLVTFPLTVTPLGTGTGNVTDNLASINCVNTAGVISGTCSASYPSGTVVVLTATATQPSTFGGYIGACTGTSACSVTMNSAQSVFASFVPPPQSLPVSFTPGTNVSAQAVYDCPSNPNPTPANPCLDPNAHAAAFTIGQVLTPFSLTVVSTEVPPLIGDGICPNGLTPAQDFDCRFKSFFTFQTRANGDSVVPLCDPYANGNCVVYSVFFQNPGQEPDPSMYVGPVNWNITFNNGAFVPPAPWTGSLPRLYYDPSGFVVPNSAYGTDCTTPMLIGNPGVPTSPAIFCQFVFDITTIFDASKKVDPLIGGKTKVFSDAVVAFPPNFAPVVTVTTTPDAATVTAGSPIGFTITVSNSAAAVANNVSLNTPLPGGTNVNWTTSPAYTGPGTCSITGAQGSQVLNCAFGTLNQSASASLHILSASSAVGTAISPSTVNVGAQQLFSIGSIVVQPIPVTFSVLTASQSITVGTSSVTLAGVIGNGTQFAPSGETVSIAINGNIQTGSVGSGGTFSLQFPTAAIPASTTPYVITYSYAGDSLLSSASNNTTTLTVTPLVVTFPLNVTLIGTGTGSVTDNLGSINCVNTAGVASGTCSANYPPGSIVSLTATATQPSTFGGWLQACSGTAGCSVTMNSAQSVTASFVPPPQALPLPFTPGTNVTGQVPFDCPSNPNPTPTNPCLDPNAHAAAFTIGQVLTPFTLTVVSTEVPPTNGDGICENGRTPGQDLDCRFGTFFTFQTKANGDRIVPLCAPYANGNCVVYSVFFQNPGQEPDPSMYVGPVNWNITYNNGTFVPPAPWTGSTPRLYYDPSGFVVPNSPYGTDCTTPMLIGNPGVPTSPAIFCQFVFDITTIFDASKKVDPLIGGKTKVFSDAIVAFPPVFAPVVTVTTTPDAATVTAGSPIGFTITVSNSALAVANNVSLNTPLPGGTNVNWTISPAYTGPGTCSITGAQGSQVLNCAFGTLNQSASATLHILSASSAAGTAISPSTVNVGALQLLSIGSIVVQPIPVTFSGLTASQTIPVGTSSVTLAGVIGNGTQFAPSGETVSITINGNKQTAAIGSNGTFSLQFPTAAIPASTTPYPITYSYAGDSLLSSATNNSTTLTVVSPPAGVNLSATMQSATIDGSGNYVFTIRVTNSGGTTATASAIKTAVLTTIVGTARLATTTTTALPASLGNIAPLSSVTATLTFPASAGPPNTAGAISLGFVFTGGSAGGTLKATLP